MGNGTALPPASSALLITNTRIPIQRTTDISDTNPKTLITSCAWFRITCLLQTSIFVVLILCDAGRAEAQYLRHFITTLNVCLRQLTNLLVANKPNFWAGGRGAGPPEAVWSHSPLLKTKTRKPLRLYV
jgi:hypothetical protein